MAALLPVLLSCSDNTVGPGGQRPVSSRYDIVLESFYGNVDFSWGRTATDLYAGRDCLLHYNGRTWTPLPVPDESSSITSGWILANGDVVYWNYTRFYRYNGTVWDYIAMPDDWNSVSGLPSGDVFVAGWNGDVHHFDGGAWSTDSVTTRLDHIHASTVNNVYATGDYGLLAHFDGLSWSTTRLDSSLAIRSVWSAPDGSAFLTFGIRFPFDSPFEAGQLLRYAPGDTLAVAGPEGFRADVLTGSGGHLYAGGRDDDGYAAYEHDGATWTRIALPPPVSSYDIAWGSGSGDIFTSDYRSGLQRSDAHGTEHMLGGENGQAVSALWTSPEGDVFAVGQGARRFDGTRWIDLAKEAITDALPSAVHGSSNRDVWAVGEKMILHYDGHTWVWVSGAFQKRLFGVWTDGRRAYAVGEGGTILGYDSREWTPMDSPTQRTLLAVTGWDGGAVAVGYYGTVVLFDGTAWREQPAPVDWDLLDVAAFGPGRIIAVGQNPWVMLDCINGTWTQRRIETHYERSFDESTAIVAMAPNDIYIAQYGGDIHHFDGRSWTLLPRFVLRGLRGIAVTPAGDVFAASPATLLRYRRR